MYIRQAKQFLRNVDATFDERQFGFASLVDLLRACQREGLFRIERDRQGVMRLFPGTSCRPTERPGRGGGPDDDDRGNVADEPRDGRKPFTGATTAPGHPPRRRSSKATSSRRSNSPAVIDVDDMSQAAEAHAPPVVRTRVAAAGRRGRAAARRQARKASQPGSRRQGAAERRAADARRAREAARAPLRGARAATTTGRVATHANLLAING